MAQNEIQVLKKCVHENIVRYIDDFYENGEIFFLMEFCPGWQEKSKKKFNQNALRW